MHLHIFTSSIFQKPHKKNTVHFWITKTQLQTLLSFTTAVPGWDTTSTLKFIYCEAGVCVYGAFVMKNLRLHMGEVGFVWCFVKDLFQSFIWFPARIQWEIFCGPVAWGKYYKGSV